MAETADIDVDVLVATRNRPEDLRQLLESVAAQTHPRFRLLVLDQSDDVAANREAAARCEGARVWHVPLTSRGKSAALNEGLRLTASPVVAFTDDDCEVPPEWLLRGLSTLLDEPRAALVFGDVVPAPHDPTTHFVPAVAFPERRTIAGPLVRSPGLIGMGANMLLRRSALADVGMFDDDLGPGGILHTGEEVELAYRLLRAGWTVVQDPGLSVIHHGARPTAGRVAADLVNVGFFAMGCGYGKNARAGDWRAVVVATHEIGRILRAMAQAALARRGPFHLRRLAVFTRGFWVGFAAGPAATAASIRRRRTRRSRRRGPRRASFRAPR